MMTRDLPLSDLNERSREVFRLVVESYLNTGEPVGSRTLSRQVSSGVSAATIRNVMQDLEELGLLDSPHISAGRLPTQIGLRMFVDGLMEVDSLSGKERKQIATTIDAGTPDIETRLEQTGTLLSRMTNSASLVIVPKSEAPIAHVEFVGLSPEQVLVVLVLTDGSVENRIFRPPLGMTPSSMREAANFLNAALEGRSLSEIQTVVAQEIARRRQEIDILSQQLIDAGMAQWSGGTGQDHLIVRGQSNLIEQNTQEEDLDRIKSLFDDLERKESLSNLLELTDAGEGVRVFIGSENKLFSLSGSSLVVSPYMNADRKVVGAIGVIGPTRLNYGRVVPIVDFTAQMVGRMMSDL